MQPTKQLPKTTVIIIAIVVTIITGVAMMLFLQKESLAPSPDSTQTSPTAPAGEQVTITGVSVCLPHRNQGESQTLECAMGLKAENGDYYGIRDPDPEYKNMAKIETGKTVKIAGTLILQEDTAYVSKGVLEIQQVETL